MTDRDRSTARACLAGADAGTMSFPDIVEALMAAGFESYAIDFRRSTASFHRPDGTSIELPTHRIDAEIAPALDMGRMQAAIREAQQQAPGYTYRGFCRKAASAGCASYVVSFLGRRALYIGRTADTHVERFPD